MADAFNIPGWGKLMYKLLLLKTQVSLNMNTETLTWSTAVHQGTQGPAGLPVPVEVGDGKLGQFVLDPSQQPLLGRLLLAIICLLLLIPHGH